MILSSSVLLDEGSKEVDTPVRVDLDLAHDVVADVILLTLEELAWIRAASVPHNEENNEFFKFKGEKSWFLV
jgi:hypothetical protein